MKQNEPGRGKLQWATGPGSRQSMLSRHGYTFYFYPRLKQKKRNFDSTGLPPRKVLNFCVRSTPRREGNDTASIVSLKPTKQYQAAIQYCVRLCNTVLYRTVHHTATIIDSIGSRPDMTFAVDWALSNNYLSIYLNWQSIGLKIQRSEVRTPSGAHNNL